MYELMLCVTSFLCLILGAVLVSVIHTNHLLAHKCAQLQDDNQRLHETIRDMQAPTNYGKPNAHAR